MKDKISNYWTNRTSKKGFFHKLKKNYLLQVLFSVRAGDELFLTRELNKNKRGKILDLACGGGKESLVAYSTVCVGVDIEGFPKEISKSRGYKEVFEWGDNYSIPTDKKFDTVTIINLNAHISFSDLKKILNSVRNNIQFNSKIIFINEFDNNNLLYQYMKRKPELFNKYVFGCKHYHFSNALQFEKEMKSISWLSLESKKVISANPPFSHLLAARGIDSNKNTVFKGVCLLADLVISSINNISSVNSGFIDGYTFKVNNKVGL